MIRCEDHIIFKLEMSSVPAHYMPSIDIYSMALQSIFGATSAEICSSIITYIASNFQEVLQAIKNMNILL